MTETTFAKQIAKSDNFSTRSPLYKVYPFYHPHPPTSQPTDNFTPTIHHPHPIPTNIL